MKNKSMILILVLILISIFSFGCAAKNKNTRQDQIQQAAINTCQEQDDGEWYENLSKWFVLSSPIERVAPWYHLPIIYNIPAGDAAKDDLPVSDISLLCDNMPNKITLDEFSDHSYIIDLAFFEPICLTETEEIVYQHKELGNRFLVIIAKDQRSADAYFDFKCDWADTPLCFYYDTVLADDSQTQLCSSLLDFHLHERSCEASVMFSESRHTAVAALKAFPGISYQFSFSDLGSGEYYVENLPNNCKAVSHQSWD